MPSHGPDMATLMQQKQEMMRLSPLSRPATAVQLLPPSTTTIAPDVVAPYDGGGRGVGGGEFDGGEEGSPFARSAHRFRT